MEKDIRNKLISLSEESYKKFLEKLIPNCYNILGVRMPYIRKLAKEILKEEKNIYEEYLNSDSIYYEETMLKGAIIGELKLEFDIVIKYIEKYIPQITNWSLCDSFCSGLKIINQDENKEKMWNILEKYLKSNNVYNIRFAIVILLNYYIEEKYLKQIFQIFDNIKNKDYYVKMAAAWSISICFIKFPNITMKYLENNKLDDETYNKALQKIIESNRVHKEVKKKIKNMKR